MKFVEPGLMRALHARESHEVKSAELDDSGMAFSEAERSSLSGKPDFEQFLKVHPEAVVALEANPGTDLPIDIVENVCRWSHASRVLKALNEISASDPTLLRWETQDLTIFPSKYWPRSPEKLR